ncbi:MAG: F0F1 ATP synthase subunit delta [Alphaproteobacteria bacterium CG11_big_fil_rev_8_21_14_0_20_44_7]|nr:MAG: F0F1 ATP synthase subunit delta [Alphaproteobacteria bacterium CG11_big_fil_rev_8_21_14_0_20_44_7]
MAKKLNTKELSRRYVTAIFELAKSSGALSKVAKDLDEVQSLLSTSEVLKAMINSPIVSAEQQMIAVEQISEKGKFDALTRNFLTVVAKNRRLKYLAEIITAFKKKISEDNNEIQAEVISAVQLSDAMVNKIKKELSAETGKKVELETQIDAEIVGGLIIKIGSKMYDYSVKSRLNKLRNDLRQAS